MKNYICVNDKKIELTQEQVEQIAAAYVQNRIQLADVAVSDTVNIGSHEMVVLEHSGDTTALIRKDLLPDRQFGENNNYAGSYVDEACNEFAKEISSAVGEKNLVLHTVDLTTDDGLKDYGKVQRQASLLTCDQYRRYAEILDEHKPDDWWWLATAYSTKKHDNDRWVKCVSPSGFICYDGYYIDDRGVRPFCILKYNIFVSK